MEENTTYQLSTSVDGKIVEVVVTGELTKTTLDRLRIEVVTLLRETKAEAMLWDSRAVKGPNEIVDAYYRARSVPVDVKNVSCAIVELTENRDYQSFYEVTAGNAGLSCFCAMSIVRCNYWFSIRL